MGKTKKIIIVVVLILLAGGAVYTYVPLKDIPYVGEFLGDLKGGAEDEDRGELEIIEKRIKVTPPANLTASSKEENIEEVVVEAQKIATPAPAATPKPAPASTPKPPVTTTSKKRPAQKPYIINVASFKTKGEALQAKSAISGGGYNVYRTEFVKDGVRWHRIRIGFYTTRAEADRVSKQVASKYGIEGGWVTKPTWKEYDAYVR